MFSGLPMVRVTCAAMLLAIATLSACSSPKPTAPTVPADANVTGVWVSPSSDYRWTLVQSATTVTGTGTGSGSIPGTTITSTLTGSVAGDVFTFSEERSWEIDGQRRVENVHSDAMQVTKFMMTGSMTFQPLFPPYRTVSPVVTMVRLIQAQ